PSPAIVKGPRSPRSGSPLPGRDALGTSRIKPLQLSAKEGLALINGTHLMAAQSALLIQDTLILHRAAITALAMSIDPCLPSHAFLDERLYAARNQHVGGRLVAGELSDLLESSQIRASHIENDPRVQDPYSLRAAPTVLGAIDVEFNHLRERFELELAAVT